MTPGGFTSCRSHSRKFNAFTEKELETMRAAQKLLVCRLLKGGEPGQGVVVEWVNGVKYIQIGTKNGQFPALID